MKNRNPSAAMKTSMTAVLFILCLNIVTGQADSSLKISRLAKDFYIYTTYNYYKGNRISANGMYVITNEGVVLFDSPWDTTRFQPLLDSIKAKHNKNVVLCIATHFHEDRAGGLEYYDRQGISTYTTVKTSELGKKIKAKQARTLISADTTFSVGQYSFETYYPGPGHTNDNIVIWFKKERILYGGCLIKSIEDSSLGNLADANVSEYAHSLRNVMGKCREPRYIIPGHNDWKSRNAIKHTLLMAEKLAQP
jgi:metallo-beta-lactamase class B